MNAPAHLLEWTEANQRLLVAEFARIKCLLRGEETAAAQGEVDTARAGLPAPAAIDRIAERFGLSPFERDVLLLAAGIEMDGEIAARCATEGGSARAPHLSFGLALALLPGAHWSALTPARPLRRWKLLEVSDEASLTAARLAIDEHVLHHLAGVDELDARLEPLLRALREEAPMAGRHAALRDDIVAALDDWPQAPLPLVQLTGLDADGKRDVASAVAGHFGLRLFALSAELVPQAPRERSALARLWEREAALLNAALLIENVDNANAAAAAELAQGIAGMVLVAAAEPIACERADLIERVDRPDRTEQLELWRQVLGSRAAALSATLDDVAAATRLSAARIRRTGRRLLARPPGPNDERELRDACRLGGLSQLRGLAQRIESSAAWDDLVLPPQPLRALQDIVVHLRHRLTVVERWGFASKGTRGLGLAALFAGESGTGKTMAAEVLAHTCAMELFRIDLAAVVSKYIGETEKNLAKVFDAAEDCRAILLFDEADALFGKRSEVRDSHDRYANVEISYLLQRMEAYRGLAILTTNLKAALDPAFMRRLRFVVHFPFPDLEQREALWRRVFPPATPTHALDYAKLARLHASGAAIRNIALHAAFLAAEAREAVTMAHVLTAARADAAKKERTLTEGEVRGWV